MDAPVIHVQNVLIVYSDLRFNTKGLCDNIQGLYTKKKERKNDKAERQEDEGQGDGCFSMPSRFLLENVSLCLILGTQLGP